MASSTKCAVYGANSVNYTVLMWQVALNVRYIALTDWTENMYRVWHCMYRNWSFNVLSRTLNVLSIVLNSLSIVLRVLAIVLNVLSIILIV